jgi:AcrR family transcriptional regulator
MAYEVTKRIKGHDYRYRVEGYRDPRSGKRKARWQYLGALTGGELVPAAKTLRKRITREDLLAATVRLLQFRDPSNVTVAIIARDADSSLSTFYRHFPDRKAAFSAALDRICGDALRALPALDAPCAGVDDARELLRAWCEGYLRTMVQQRALRWALTQGQRGVLRARIERSLMHTDSSIPLAAFLRQLVAQGFATIDNPDELAHAIRGVHAALLLATVSESPFGDITAPTIAEVFPLVERAVFGS